MSDENLCQNDAKQDRWLLQLYVAGQTAKSVKAIANLREICETYLTGKYSIEVIDLMVTPEAGKADQILAIPTLVRKLPTPLTKIIGDLSSVERILAGLNITSDQGKTG